MEVYSTDHLGTSFFDYDDIRIGEDYMVVEKDLDDDKIPCIIQRKTWPSEKDISLFHIDDIQEAIGLL